MIICRFGATRDGLIADFAERYLAGKKILEIGCGSGDRTKLFYDVSSHVVAIDIVDNVSKKWKRKFSFLLAEATKLPFRDESFGAVASIDVLEHVLDNGSFIAEAFRVCERKGYLVLGTPNRLRLSNVLRNLLGRKIVYLCHLGPGTIHVREYTREELISLVKSVGFAGDCIPIWLGLVGRIDRGLKKPPEFISSLAHYLLVIGYKP